MTTGLIAALQEIQETHDSLGPEHSVPVVTARIELRNAFLKSREMVLGSTVLDGVALRQMDSLDAMVRLWIAYRERADGVVASRQTETTSTE